MSDAATFLVWSAGMLIAALGWVWLIANEIVRLSVEVDAGDAESARREILRGLYSFRIVTAAILLALLFGLARIRAGDFVAALLVIANTTALHVLAWRQSQARAAALAERLGISIRFGGKLLGRNQ